MKPARFEYVLAHSVAEALEALNGDGEARLLAGGQSLVPLMNLRLARPSVVIDINNIDGLDHIDESDGQIALGALVRHRRLEHFQPVPLFAEAVTCIGHPQVRNRGTLGGSLAHGDPAAELPACVVAMDGVIVLEGRRGQREVPANEFFTGFLSTAAQAGEMVVGVRVPRPQWTCGTALVEQTQRHGDYAFAGVAVSVHRNGVCRSVRAGAISLADRTLDISAAFAHLVGKEVLERRALAEVTDAVDDLIEPPDDVHATATYRREVARLVVAEAIERAWRRSGGETAL